MRILLASLVVLAFGCAEPEPEIRPVTTRGEPRARLRPRAPEVVSPELRVRQTGEERAAERERLGLGGAGASGADRGGSGGGAGGAGGGGGGAPDPWVMPHRGREPSAREVEAYREELAAQMERRVDPDDDPCEQLRATWAATAGAVDRALPEGRGRPPAATPSRAEMRRACRQMPAGYLQCMDRTYFDEHREACQLEIQRLARRGRQRSEAARRELEEIERGNAPDPSEPDPTDQDDG